MKNLNAKEVSETLGFETLGFETETETWVVSVSVSQFETRDQKSHYQK